MVAGRDTSAKRGCGVAASGRRAMVGKSSEFLPFESVAYGASVLLVLQGLADARKRARRSGLVQFFAVYQFDRGGILQMCHTVGELCNHAVRGSVVWRLISDTM